MSQHIKHLQRQHDEDKFTKPKMSVNLAELETFCGTSWKSNKAGLHDHLSFVGWLEERKRAMGIVKVHAGTFGIHS